MRRKSLGQAPSETRFSVPVARRLGALLEAIETRQETVTLTGILSGAGGHQTFELEVDDSSDVIQGTVTLALRHAVRSAFDRHVEVTLVRTIVRASVEGEESSSYSLIDLRTSGRDAGFRLPEIE